MKKGLLLLYLLAICVSSFGQSYNLPVQNDRWSIQPDGSIEWFIGDRLPHGDHIEMSGQKVSLWMQYDVNTNAAPVLNRTIIFPTFRLLPVQTTAHMMYNVKDEELPRIIINDRLYKAGVYNASVQAGMPEKLISIRQKGIMEIFSEIGRDGTIKLHRSFFPSVDKPMAIEKLVFTNQGKQPVTIEMEYMNRESKMAAERSSGGQHSFIVATVNDGLKTIHPNDSVTFAITYQAVNKKNDFVVANVDAEEKARRNRVAQMQSHLQLETPDVVLNTMFAFAKIRATESIYNTKGGLMHGPGGLRYYAAIWANDQAEYVNPFFGFLGDSLANKSAMNAFRLFARYMNAGYKPIPSSIIAEGDDIWNGAGDRGDMAMIAYGAGRFALAYGNKDSAKVLWPLIEWCLEYLNRNVNGQGVVRSDRDELEGRFPSGNANLNTSSLYYDALKSAMLLGKLLSVPSEKIKLYNQRAKNIRASIEQFFGATVEGFKTYRYYEGNDTLRAWITTPLTVDIFDRKKGTIAALFSPRLWTEDGLASLAGNQTFWDRSTLYGLRGAFAAGETEKALRFLKYYSQRRLLGEHVPYAVEAYPEGNQRHLAAESGLYCRIFTEGMFGMRPAGFTSFNMTPHLPEQWNRMALRNIHSFGNVFDVEVSRNATNKLRITIVKGTMKKQYLIKEGATQNIQL
ncbi:MAG: hypothetical protein ACTHMD_05690 [Flavisolibacter sp.]